MQCKMCICPAFHKESAPEAGVPLRGCLLTETNSFMQHLQDEILHQQLLLAVSIKLILSFTYCSYLCKSSQKSPCCILRQPKSPQECRILVTEPHHPCTNKLIKIFRDYQIHNSLSHVRLPRFSSLSRFSSLLLSLFS